MKKLKLKDLTVKSFLTNSDIQALAGGIMAFEDKFDSPDSGGQRDCKTDPALCP